MGEPMGIRALQVMASLVLTRLCFPSCPSNLPKPEMVTLKHPFAHSKKACPTISTIIAIKRLVTKRALSSPASRRLSCKQPDITPLETNHNNNHKQPRYKNSVTDEKLQDGQPSCLECALSAQHGELPLLMCQASTWLQPAARTVSVPHTCCASLLPISSLPASEDRTSTVYSTKVTEINYLLQASFQTARVTLLNHIVTDRLTPESIVQSVFK